MARVRGFTLIELLVVIAIIATLVGILVPALAGVRERARTAACISNSGQMAKAWHSYVADYRYFPHAGIVPRPDGKVDHGEQTLGWVGVDWYGDEGREQEALFTHADSTRERPLNEYVGLPAHVESGDGGVSHCPGDTGLMTVVDPTDFYNPQPPLTGYETSDEAYRYRLSRSPEGASTAHGLHGTSYLANDWVWVSPSAPWGFNINNDRQRELWLTFKNSTEDVTDPSRFVLFGDLGIMNVLRVNTFGNGIPAWLFSAHQFRHGPENTVMGFLDGSARLVKMPFGGGEGSYASPSHVFHPNYRRVLGLIQSDDSFNFNGRGFGGNPPPSVRAEFNLD